MEDRKRKKRKKNWQKDNEAEKERERKDRWRPLEGKERKGVEETFKRWRREASWETEEDRSILWRRGRGRRGAKAVAGGQRGREGERKGTIRWKGKRWME